VAEARAAWRAELAGVDPARLIFIDETGIDTRMTRPYARAARGQRAVGKVPRGRWERLTVIGALALDGLVASRGVAAATGTAVFLAFTEEVLIPALRERPDALVVMDNLGAHKAEKVREALDRAGLGHRGPWPRAGAAGPGAAVLLAGHEPDRASLVQAQDPAAGGRRPLEGGPGGRPRPGARHHHRAGCPRLVPPRRLPGRGLTRNPL
jgi:hypothetical protein